MKAFALVDTNNLAHRYSVVNLTNSSGMPVGIVYSLVRLLRLIVIKENVDYLTFFFDFPAKDSFDGQLEKFRELLDALRVNYIVASPEIPADYYLASYVNWLKNNTNFIILIYSNDHDFLQLVDERTWIIQNETKRKIYGLEDVRKEFGVEPQQLPDYWALTGDKTDKIEGIRGIGKKRGLSLISKYGDLLGILSYLETIKRFRGCTESAWAAYNKINLLDKNLRFFDCYSPSCKHLKRGEFDLEKTRKIFVELEFVTYLNLLVQGLLFRDRNESLKKVMLEEGFW